jgi:hypothetical protein
MKVEEAMKLVSDPKTEDESLVEYSRVRVRTRDFAQWATTHARAFAKGSILQVYSQTTPVSFRADRSIAELAKNRISYYEFKILEIGKSW